MLEEKVTSLVSDRDTGRLEITRQQAVIRQQEQEINNQKLVLHQYQDQLEVSTITVFRVIVLRISGPFSASAAECQMVLTHILSHQSFFWFLLKILQMQQREMNEFVEEERRNLEETAQEMEKQVSFAVKPHLTKENEVMTFFSCSS